MEIRDLYEVCEEIKNVSSRLAKEEIIDALENDMLLPYMQEWELERIVDFVIKNYKENE